MVVRLRHDMTKPIMAVCQGTPGVLAFPRPCTVGYGHYQSKRRLGIQRVGSALLFGGPSAPGLPGILGLGEVQDMGRVSGDETRLSGCIPSPEGSICLVRYAGFVPRG